MTVICKSTAKRRSLILPSGQELICSRALNRCVPHSGKHTCTHTTQQPWALTFTQRCWPLQGKEQMEWLGLAGDRHPGDPALSL